MLCATQAHDLSSPTFSIHAMLKAVREEAKSLNTLESLDVLSGDEDVALERRLAILKLATPEAPGASAPGGGAPPKRVDLLSGSKNAVTYANNLEKDPMYKRWPRTVEQLLYPSWQLTSVAKNLYTAVFFLDASTDDALQAIHIASLMMRQGYPVRVAFVLGSKQDEPGDDGALSGGGALEAADASTLFAGGAEVTPTFDLDEAAMDEIVSAFVSAPPVPKADATNSAKVDGRRVATLAALARVVRGPRASWLFLETLGTTFVQYGGVTPTLGEAVAAYAEAITAQGTEDATSDVYNVKKKAGAKKDAWRALQGEHAFFLTL